MALNRGPELSAHVGGAPPITGWRKGGPEAIRHTATCVGVPSGVEEFKIAGRGVLQELKESGEYMLAIK